MKNILLILLFLISTNLTFGQTEYSKHSIKFFKNNKQKSLRVLDIWIIVDGIKIQGEKVGDFYQFPIIDSTKRFELGIKTNKMKIESGSFEARMLNNGSIMILGKITRINKLLSVAEYSEMEKSEDDYEIFAKRFFIANKVYTIDINNHEKVKQLEYLIVKPNQKGCGSYVSIQNIVKLKK
ncbi:hypothetical protein [Aureivirga sp. CE67]|uniref:hypothetical protein n=1 Tax=Aureivirga sp. CE67 TaxID=1788983 RepID=UPI0018CBD172|nr:hypothetical protein [Aureivirga sp. CE67]